MPFAPHPIQRGAFVVPTGCDLWPSSQDCSQECCPPCPQAGGRATEEVCFGSAIPAPKPAALLSAEPNLSGCLLLHVLRVLWGSES